MPLTEKEKKYLILIIGDCTMEIIIAGIERILARCEHDAVKDERKRIMNIIECINARQISVGDVGRLGFYVKLMERLAKASLEKGET